MDLLIDAIQELCNNVVRSTTNFVSKAKDVMVDGESFLKFSKYVQQIRSLLQVLKDKKVNGTAAQEQSIKAMLEKLDSQLKKASEIIEKNMGRSHVSLFLNCQRVLSQMDTLAKEIAETVSLFGAAANLGGNLLLKSELDQLVQKMGTLEFKMAANTERITSEVNKALTENGRGREQNIELIQRIAAALGVGANVVSAKTMVEQMKREKEELEAEKLQAEAFQLSQLIELLQDDRPTTSRQEPVSAFKCPLSEMVMEVPVAIFCGHSFEQNAIQQYFAQGRKTCPVCQLDLASLQLTPNISLRNSIQEWKQRNMETEFNIALVHLRSEDSHEIDIAVNHLQTLLGEPQFRTVIADEKLIPKIVQSLKSEDKNTVKAALKCLCHLAKHSNATKQRIVEAEAVRRIVKMFYTSMPETDAIEIIAQVSDNDTVIEKIGSTRHCIPFLVSILQNPNQEISRRAHKVIQNLSTYVHFVIKMAEAGYLDPFLVRFSKGPSEMQASMAAELTKMQLPESSLKTLDQKEFVSSLVRALASGVPAGRAACLLLIKKLSVHPRMAKRFIAETETIPALVCALNYGQSSQQVATEILTCLVQSTQLSDFETNNYLQELQSQHIIQHLLRHSMTCEAETKARFLSLIFAICNLSETCRSMVRTDDEAVAYLFSCLDNGREDARQQALKLLYFIGQEPGGIPLPPSPAKETSIHSLVAILGSSRDMEERSLAAGIISLLPGDDQGVDDILSRSEALKAIREVISTMEEGNLHRHGSSSRTIATPSGSLLENALAALLRYTEPSKPQLQKLIEEQAELYPSLIRVLSRGSSLAKQRTATALAHLSLSTIQTASITNNNSTYLGLMRALSRLSRCCSSSGEQDAIFCFVHGESCSSSNNFCLIRANAIKPLIHTLKDTESEAAEAAIIALNTLVDKTETRSHAALIIVENNGAGAILDVLERGNQRAKEKALDLFQKLFESGTISDAETKRSRGILIHHLADDLLKKRAAIALSLMDVIPQQSSYF